MRLSLHKLRLNWRIYAGGLSTIEFEGVVLLPADSSSAQPMVSLVGPAEGAALDAGAIPGGSTGDDAILQENAQEAGDEWIARWLSGTSSDAIAAGMPGPGEVDLLDPQATEGDGEEDQVIVITGSRTSTGRSYTWDGNDQSETWGTGSGTGGGTGTYATAVTQHTQDCGTEDGAAVQVAKHVKGELPANVSGPVDPVKTSSGNDWTKVEFGALIVKNSNGSFGALNDTIYSNDLSNYIQIQYNTPQSIQGFWHSHPDTNSGIIDKLKGRYPSSADWNTLARIAGGAGAVQDPSLWIMDYSGTTREFKLSERSYFESLDDTQQVEGTGLDGKERAQSCG